MANARWAADRARRDAGIVDREEPFEDVIARAKQDRRGSVIREGCSYSATATNHWCLRWSVAGRVDQMDVVFNGSVVFTGGRRRIADRWPWLVFSG